MARRRSDRADRLTELRELLGVSRSTIYNWIVEGRFPLSVHVSERTVRWRAEDIEAWRTRALLSNPSLREVSNSLPSGSADRSKYRPFLRSWKGKVSRRMRDLLTPAFASNLDT